MPAETRYACHGQDYIAYQTVGEGPRDIVFMSAWFSHVDGRWEEPRFAAMLRRLSTMGRLIVFDKRGSGASDPLASAEPTWEDWADDIAAVMDAAGSKRASLIGVGDSGPLALLYAATRPQRVESLVLINTGARLRRASDYPWGIDQDEETEFLRRTRETWGVGGLVDVFSPSAAADESYRQWLAKYQRMSASPGRSTAMARLIFDIDVRDVLSTIHVPTLVMHRKDFRFFPIEFGRYLAEHIAGAKFIELRGADGSPEGLVGELEYATDLFDRSTVERLAWRFVRLLEGMVGEPDRAIGGLDILQGGERELILYASLSAVAFYEANGWRTVREHRDGDARLVVMTKSLRQ